jgi:Uma2 family endonuclease
MAAILDLPEIRARVHLWTVADYEKLGDNPAFRRSELLRGIIVEKMSKSPLHSTLATRIYLFLVRLLRPGLIARKEEPLRLADSMPEPDISVLRGTLADFATHHPSMAELVVEMAVSSSAPDRENASIYAEAGVAEYWIILAANLEVEVYRGPENGVYREMITYRRGEAIPDVAVLGQAVAVDALFQA